MFLFVPLIFATLFYAWWRFRFVFPRKYRYPGALLFTLCFAAMFFYRGISNDSISAIFAAIGSFGFVFLTNWLLFCIFWDLFLGIRRLRGKRKLANKRLRMRKEPLFASAIGALTLAFFLIGGPPAIFDFKVVKVKETLPIKPKEDRQLKIALFSDVHFDALFQISKLEKIVDSLQILRPDAVFLVGDIADVPIEKLRIYDTLFSQIRAPLGFYIYTGNHESFMNPEGRTMEWLRSFDNATILIDETVCNNYFCVTGRADHQYAKRHASSRTALKDLTPSNSSIPWFLLDHQPHGLDRGDTNLARKPDFAFSGHTHAGQFFPAAIIIKFIWPLSYGLGKLDGIPWFVTSGIGQWGPPLRIGSHTELVLFLFE